MASVFGHAASILGISKLFPNAHIGKKVLFLGILSAIMPDADVVAFNFGIPYEHFLGHRGLTHAPFFAMIWSYVIVTIFHRKDCTSRFLLFIYYFICTASHGFLDAMTTGGEGVAFFIPWNDGRYFLPWRMIKVSPLGASHFFSEWGFKVLVSEFKYIGIPSLLLFVLGILLNKKVYK